MGEGAVIESRIKSYFAPGDYHLQPSHWRRYWKALRLIDAACDLRIAPALRRARADAASAPRQSILVAATEVPGREADLRAVLSSIGATRRHDVSFAVTPMAPVGKFVNINAAIAGLDMQRYDWLLIADDDVALPEEFLDLLIYFAHRFSLTLAQPAHRFLSFTSFKVTERRWASLARRTSFVEIGPVSLIHRSAFTDLVPFPPSRWGWGLDMYWADLAKRNGWNLGVVDAVALRHCRPVGGSYSRDAAIGEAIDFLTAHGVGIDRDEMFSSGFRLA